MRIIFRKNYRNVFARLYQISRRSFSLIEVLVALVIFSFAIAICGGIFSMILGNQSLISTSSEVNKESGRILRQISDDIVNATTTGTATKNGAAYLPEIRGIAFLTSDNKIVNLPDTCLASPSTSCPTAAGLVLFAKDNIKIYRFSDQAIKYIATAGTTLKLDSNGRLSPDEYSDNKFQILNNDKVEVASLEFSGISCYRSSCDVSPFAKIQIKVQTKDYATRAAGRRSQIFLETSVANRAN